MYICGRCASIYTLAQGCINVGVVPGVGEAVEAVEAVLSVPEVQEVGFREQNHRRVGVTSG